MELDNLMVGNNIAKYRWLKDIKAHDMAEALGMKESTYTKYERGETAITIDFVKKVAEILKADPLLLLSTSPGNFVESINNSAVTMQGNSTYQNTNQEHMTTMLKLMENIVAVNERMSLLLERK